MCHKSNFFSFFFEMSQFDWPIAKKKKKKKNYGASPKIEDSMERWRASPAFGPPHNMLPSNDPMCIKALVLGCHCNLSKEWESIATKCNLLGKASNFAMNEVLQCMCVG